MATARGFLRQRSSLGGDIEEIVSDVNRQLTMDVEDSGLFMTLFYMTLDMENRRAQWVRAGHELGIFYDPASDTFEELRGPGIALGVNEEYSYQKTEKTGLAEGQIILVGTDGLWDTTNPNEEMFGKEPIYDIVRRNASAGAEEISDRIFRALSHFKEDSKAQDDVTLVVMKMEQSS
jgi:sigma-B regulation protein RsbU (phosphoserine phosphatase)